jgi:curved DNA-binding protein CbpA
MWLGDPWQVLGVAPGCDADALREVYRQLVRLHHPDRFPAGSPAQARAHALMADINAAYRMVNDPAELERFRRLQRARVRGSRGATPGDDGVRFAASDPRGGGGIEPAPGDPDFDYRVRAWREFPAARQPVAPPWTSRPARRRPWARRGEPA